MKILELEPRFKTKELIESMIEVAEFQASRMKHHSLCAPWDSAVHINLGRRAGHTCALKELASESDMLIITPNEQLSWGYRSSGIRTQPINGTIHGFRGIHAPILVFESIHVERAREFYREFGSVYIRPKAILLVGCY